MVSLGMEEGDRAGIQVEGEAALIEADPVPV